MRALWGLVLVDLLARTSYGLARTPVLPLLAAHLGAGPAMVGLIGAASTVTGVFLKLPAGVLADALGRAPVMLFGLVSFALGPFLMVITGSPVALLAVRAYHGSATAVYSPASMAVVAAAAGPRKGEILSWLSNTKTVAGLAGAFLGGVILSMASTGDRAGGGVAEHAAAVSHGMLAGERAALAPSAGGFAWALGVAGALGLAALAVGVLVVRKASGPPPAAPKRWPEVSAKFRKGLRQAVSDRRVFVASSCEGVQNLTTGMMEQFLPLYAVFAAGRTPLEAGLLWAVQAVSTVATKPVFGRWGDRHGRVGVLVAGLWVCALPFALVPWTTSLALLLVLAALWGLGEALVTSSSSAYAAEVCEEQSLGGAMGVFGTIGDLGHAAGPVLGGLLIGVAGGAADPAASGPYRLAFGVVAALLVLYAIPFARVRRAPRSPAA